MRGAPGKIRVRPRLLRNILTDQTLTSPSLPRDAESLQRVRAARMQPPMQLKFKPKAHQTAAAHRRPARRADRGWQRCAIWQCAIERMAGRGRAGDRGGLGGLSHAGAFSRRLADGAAAGAGERPAERARGRGADADLVGHEQRAHRSRIAIGSVNGEAACCAHPRKAQPRFPESGAGLVSRSRRRFMSQGRGASGARAAINLERFAADAASIDIRRREWRLRSGWGRSTEVAKCEVSALIRALSFPPNCGQVHDLTRPPAFEISSLFGGADPASTIQRPIRRGELNGDDASSAGGDTSRSTR